MQAGPLAPVAVSRFHRQLWQSKGVQRGHVRRSNLSRVVRCSMPLPHGDMKLNMSYISPATLIRLRGVGPGMNPTNRSYPSKSEILTDSATAARLITVSPAQFLLTQTCWPASTNGSSKPDFRLHSIQAVAALIQKAGVGVVRLEYFHELGRTNFLL